MKRSMRICAVALALAMSACSGGDTTTTNVTSCQPRIWDGTQPPCTVAVNFTVDDHVNQVYSISTSGVPDLQWKGSFVYDPVTREAFYDSNWGYGRPSALAPLYDDGPWDEGGHEPLLVTSGAAQVRSVAGDHRWGTTIFVPLPAASQTWNYGLVDAPFNYGWIWAGSGPGSFTVTPSSSAPITASGQSFAPFGTTDLRLTLDVATMDAGFLASTADLSQPKVKGSKWGWNLVTMYDDGTHGDATASDGIWTFVLSDWMGPGKTYYHSGLASSGEEIQFVFTVGATDKEYKQNGVPPTAGVSGAVRPSGGVWTNAPPANYNVSQNPVKARTLLSGCAPTNASTGRPPTNA